MRQNGYGTGTDRDMRQQSGTGIDRGMRQNGYGDRDMREQSRQQSRDSKVETAKQRQSSGDVPKCLIFTSI